jgi:hypothetical protein
MGQKRAIVFLPTLRYNDKKMDHIESGTLGRESDWGMIGYVLTEQVRGSVSILIVPLPRGFRTPA